jgi:cytochrome c oxidase subunit 3
MFLTIIGGMIFVGSQAWEWNNFIKENMVQSETKGVVYFSLLIKMVIVALADFAATLPCRKVKRRTKST